MSYEQPELPFNLKQNSPDELYIPEFLAGNPEAVEAIKTGHDRASYDLEHPGQQSLPNPRIPVDVVLPITVEQVQAVPAEVEVRKSELKSFNPDTGTEVVEHRPVEENTPTDEEKRIGSIAIEGIRKSVYGRGPGR